MSLYAFLAALPALIAVVGFVVYRLLHHENRAQDVTTRIVDKLRVGSPQQVAKIEGLGPKQVAAALARDHELRTAVSEQDFQLLTSILRFGFFRSLVVYGLIALSFAGGVGAFVHIQTRPKILALYDWHLESADPEAKGWAVDTDDLILTWKGDGLAEDLAVALENVQTGRRSGMQVVSSAEGRLTFRSGTYAEILGSRERGAVNRVRAVASARASKKTFTSQEFSLRVGIQVLALPLPDDRAVWITALIDNSSIPHYVFDAKLLIWRKDGSDTISFGDTMRNPKTVFDLGDPALLDLTSMKIAYFGPDDSRIVRTGVLGQQ